MMCSSYGGTILYNLLEKVATGMGPRKWHFKGVFDNNLYVKMHFRIII